MAGTALASGESNRHIVKNQQIVLNASKKRKYDIGAEISVETLDSFLADHPELTFEVIAEKLSPATSEEDVSFYGKLYSRKIFLKQEEELRKEGLVWDDKKRKFVSV